VNNADTSNTCPKCRKHAEVSHLRTNLIISEALASYSACRKELLQVVKDAKKVDEKSSSCVDSSNLQFKSTATEKPVSQKMTHINCHILTKANVKRELEKLTSRSKVKVRLDGDKTILDRRVRELVHLNNAQLDSPSPMTLTELVTELNRREDARDAEEKKAAKMSSQLDDLRKGKVSIASCLIFTLSHSHTNALNFQLLSPAF